MAVNIVEQKTFLLIQENLGIKGATDETAVAKDISATPEKGKNVIF